MRTATSAKFYVRPFLDCLSHSPRRSLEIPKNLLDLLLSGPQVLGDLLCNDSGSGKLSASRRLSSFSQSRSREHLSLATNVS